MSLKSFIQKFFRKEEIMKPLSVERVGIKHRLVTTKKKKYLATVALVYKGTPLRQFHVTDNGYSRDVVAKQINDQLTFKLLSVKQTK